MRSICFISAFYPTVISPTSHVFVRNLVWGLADQGVECSVISPVAINLNYKYASLPKVTEERTPSGSVVKLYFPRFISFGQRKLAGFKTTHLTTQLFHNAVRKQFREFEEKPEVVYGHFITPAGITAARIGREFGIPAFAAYGESTPWSINNYGLNSVVKELETLSGIVSVSSNNKDTLKNLGILNEDKIAVFPNAIDSSRYYPRDKAEARKKFGFPQDAFIVAFVGQFSERKGVLRVAEALDGLEGVSVIYAGKGEQTPNNSNILHCGLVKPEEIPVFLSTADAFLLPTLNEGCCNAIVEAMACGLPVISSNLPFNFDILSKDTACLIDPSNVAEIRQAVLKLKEDQHLRANNRAASLARASMLSQKNRANNIWNWIKAMSENSNSRKGDKLFESASTR
ncbi:MAG TPA: glycosyltransferase family 4 protein [Desulfitobacteriaceae bacterium]|nr:glycosyltransferase family 4 protein [Desulfitobacteriaceae bacterium]